MAGDKANAVSKSKVIVHRMEISPEESVNHIKLLRPNKKRYKTDQIITLKWDLIQRETFDDIPYIRQKDPDDDYIFTCIHEKPICRFTDKKIHFLAIPNDKNLEAFRLLKAEIAYGLSVMVVSNWGKIIKGIITNEYALIYASMPDRGWDKIDVVENTYFARDISANILLELSSYLERVIRSHKILNEYKLANEMFFWRHPIKCGNFELIREMVLDYIEEIRGYEKTS